MQQDFMTGYTDYRWTGGDGRAFDMRIEWRQARGGSAELVAYSLRSVDGGPIPPELRHSLERGLDGELVNAAYAQTRATHVAEQALPPGTLRLSVGADSIEVPVSDRQLKVKSRYADPDAAAAALFAEAEAVRKRRTITPELLAEVAKIYKANPRTPTKAVSEALHVSAAQASRYVKAARVAGDILPRERS